MRACRQRDARARVRARMHSHTRRILPAIVHTLTPCLPQATRARLRAEIPVFFVAVAILKHSGYAANDLLRRPAALSTPAHTLNAPAANNWLASLASNCLPHRFFDYNDHDYDY